MLGSSLIQLLVFPIGVLYLLLHLGPFLRLFYEPSIRGGTRWPFFASELGMFSLWLLGSPVLWNSSLGRFIIILHMSMHAVFTVMDYVAHDFLLHFALVRRATHPGMWLTKELGLAIDTLTHAGAVILVALTLKPLTAILLSIPSFVAYAWATSAYQRRYGSVPAEGG